FLKKNRPSELNDFRPVALTSHLMKTLERLFLSLLRPQVQHAQDRLQFAYQPGVGVEDAILYLLHRAHSHLDKGSGTVGRESVLRRSGGSVFQSWGAEQLKALLPMVLRRAGGTVRWIEEEDRRWKITSLAVHNTSGCGWTIKLDWTTHTSHLFGKTQSRMYFLRRLRSFNICSKLLQMFYQSVVASVLFYTVVCWGGSISKKDTSRLDKLIRRAGSVVGTKLDSL
ncbi:hypothetical protein L3Q82_012919, partial [Scortum barcoo]